MMILMMLEMKLIVMMVVVMVVMKIRRVGNTRSGLVLNVGGRGDHGRRGVERGGSRRGRRRWIVIKHGGLLWKVRRL